MTYPEHDLFSLYSGLHCEMAEQNVMLKASFPGEFQAESSASVSLEFHHYFILVGLLLKARGGVVHVFSWSPVV